MVLWHTTGARIGTIIRPAYEINNTKNTENIKKRSENPHPRAFFIDVAFFFFLVLFFFSIFLHFRHKSLAHCATRLNKHETRAFMLFSPTLSAEKFTFHGWEIKNKNEKGRISKERFFSYPDPSPLETLLIYEF